LKEKKISVEGRNLSTRIFKNAVAFLGGEFFYRLINFFACILIARSLGRESYGQFSFIYVYLSFFEVFVQFGLNPILTRELSQDKQRGPAALGNALLLRTLLILLAIPAAWELIRLSGYPLSVKQGVFLASFQLFLTLRPVFEAIFRSELAMLYPALWNGIRALLNLMLVGIAVLALPSLPIFILAYLVSGFVGLAGLWLASSRRMPFRFRWDKPIMRHLVKQSLPMVFSGYLTLLYYRIDVMMLSVMKGFQEIGYYSVATRLTESLNMISGALLISFFPLFASTFKESRVKFELFYTQAFRWLLLLGLPLALGGSLVARELILLFFGAEYAPSGITLTILLWYTFFCFIGSLLANILIACGKQVTDMWISGLLVLLNVALNALLIPRLSYNGAALATVTTEAMGVIIYFRYGAKDPEIRLNLPRRELANVFKVNLLFAALLLLAKKILHLGAVPFVFLGIIVYGALLFGFRIVTWKEAKTHFIGVLKLDREVSQGAVKLGEDL